MAVSCVSTPSGDFYSLTDSNIIHWLSQYTGNSELQFMKEAEEVPANEVRRQFDIYYKDIKRVLYGNFKMKKSIDGYDNIELARFIISYDGGDDDNYLRNSLIAIMKVLNHIKQEMEKLTDENIKTGLFRGDASFYNLLLFHIQEFAEEVASYKESKNYRRSKSRKQLKANEVFGLARNLPRQMTFSNDLTHVYESVFFIRQAIELKVLESLHIFAVINEESGRILKISPDQFIKLLDNDAVKLVYRDFAFEGDTPQEKVREYKLDVDFIKKAHAWTNTFIHCGASAWMWEVEFVRMSLQDFIYIPIEIDKNYLRSLPDLILTKCVKEEERETAKVIMTKEYDRLLAQ